MVFPIFLLSTTYNLKLDPRRYSQIPILYLTTWIKVKKKKILKLSSLPDPPIHTILTLPLDINCPQLTPPCPLGLRPTVGCMKKSQWPLIPQNSKARSKDLSCLLCSWQPWGPFRLESAHFPNVVVRGARWGKEGFKEHIQRYEEFKILHLEEENSLVLFYLFSSLNQLEITSCFWKGGAIWSYFRNGNRNGTVQ